MRKILLLIACFSFVSLSVGCNGLGVGMNGSLGGNTAPTITSQEINPDIWAASLNNLSQEEQYKAAASIYNKSDASQALKERALYILATRSTPESLAYQQVLSRLYSEATPENRAKMERVLLNDLRSTPPETLQFLARSILRVQETSFPWIAIMWEAANKGLLVDNAGTIARIGNAAYFAHPALFGLQPGMVLDSMGTSASTEINIPNIQAAFNSTCVSIILPMTGTFGSVGKQVAQGAMVAQEVLAQRGAHIALTVIDSEDPSWVAKLNALPPTCTLVGGPLRADTFLQAADANLLASRAFFTFMPQLPNGFTEGQQAWRFFASPEDQINTVLDFAIVELGLQRFAAIYPEDSYGARMSQIFVDAAQRRGAGVDILGYPLDDSGQWTSSIGKFLGSVAGAKGALPRVTASFKAAFFPDSWKNMEMLASIMHYHGANYMPILGTSIWEQSLNTLQNLNVNYFKLAVFPGAWNPYSPSMSAENLRLGLMARNMVADDWAALGFDFILFASGMNMENFIFNPQILNQKLYTLQPLPWAAAPVVWDAAGKASRKLFLFQPSAEGMKLLNKEEYLMEFEKGKK